MRQIGLLLVLASVSSVALAEPTPLVIDKNVSDMASPRHIRNVHEEVKTKTTDLEKIRSAILEAMAIAKGGPWTLEDDGDGFLLARMEYRDNSMTLRIEYNAELVQLKYYDATNLYVCEAIVGDGICYKNYRDYYGFAQNLRGSITRELKRVR